MKKRLFTASVLATSMLWLAAAPGTAVAQDKYPSKSVRWIVPYAAGGGSDFWPAP
jgi:tripartite-type tricarboxylate transporter receptor subunit TctC